MSRSHVVLFGLLGGLLAAPPSVVLAQQPQEIPFDSTADFLKFPPGSNSARAPGIALNSKGHVFVYTRRRGRRATSSPRRRRSCWEFGPDGKFIRELENLYSKAWAHAVRVDSQDNIWWVDNGSDMVSR